VEALLHAGETAPGWWSPGTQGGAPPRPAKAAARDSEWAVPGTVPDLKAAYERLRPRMARRFPFELDVFQKEAVLHMEQASCSCLAVSQSVSPRVRLPLCCY
jgi:hypothetical protein